ncbi:hypothetical protein F4861DRAFT_466995 [Xylaria intraflava]|nr:hypothetical protein F4861DRAFT_466995 [Xylaria intraflava]
MSTSWCRFEPISDLMTYGASAGFTPTPHSQCLWLNVTSRLTISSPPPLLPAPLSIFFFFKKKDDHAGLSLAGLVHEMPSIHVTSWQEVTWEVIQQAVDWMTEINPRRVVFHGCAHEAARKTRSVAIFELNEHSEVRTLVMGNLTVYLVGAGDVPDSRQYRPLTADCRWYYHDDVASCLVYVIQASNTYPARRDPEEHEMIRIHV